MIVVTAPTGDIGQQVLENILRRDEPISVIERESSALPAKARKRVEVVEGSHTDEQTTFRAWCEYALKSAVLG